MLTTRQRLINEAVLAGHSKEFAEALADLAEAANPGAFERKDNVEVACFNAANKR